jgi:S-adenosylmethionine decarboxylase
MRGYALCKVSISTMHISHLERPVWKVVGDATPELGRHCLLDLFECDYSHMSDGQALIDALSAAALQAGATVISSHSHNFEPQGASAFCLLAESHISIHTWPERRAATLDVYTCGVTCDPLAACRYIIAVLKPADYVLQEVRRGARMRSVTEQIAWGQMPQRQP